MGIKGNVRAIDELGRVVLPIDFRSELDIKPGDFLKMEMDGDKIIVRKNTPSCVFCGTEKELLSYLGKNICKSCKEKISEK